MTKQYLFLIGSLLVMQFVMASNDPDFEAESDAFAKIYSNFHLGISNSDQNSAFEITRAYFGYKHNFDEAFSATVKLDIGSPDDVSDYSRLRRYAYFKTAALTYMHKNLTVNFGLIDLYQFKTQEKFWGKRYIYKSFQDEHKFGSSADIGLAVLYTINSKLSCDFVVMNGEGYKSLQADNTYQTSIGITYKPLDFLITRLYYDYTDKSIIQNNFSAFIGFDYSKYKLGFEYNFDNNSQFYENRNLTGYSIFGAYTFKQNIELFARYDILRSNELNNSEIPWNLSNDGSAIITGIQYKPHEKVKLALNYQDWYPYASDEPNLAYIYFNVEFSF
jgi:hypothetical protein